MAKTFLKVVALSAILAIAAAKCPNSCSGHGVCHEDDLCECWPGYVNYDCSQRSCSSVEAWAVNNADPHHYAECSNNGVCNTDSGLCDCFKGYSGEACERGPCPNDCSGHGKCRMLQDLANYKQNTQLTWDDKAIQACVCDGGFFGPDCSWRICPFGDDPQTHCDEPNTEQIQQVKFTFDGNLANPTTDVTTIGISDVAFVVNDEFYVNFTDYAGNNWVTKRVTGAFGSNGASTPLSAFDGDRTNAAKRFEAALESLPNFAIRDVTVTKSVVDTSSKTSVTSAFQVTFHHEGNGQNSHGAQNLIGCPSAWSCPYAGCQPKVRQPYLVTILENNGRGGNYKAVTSAALGSSGLGSSLPDTGAGGLNNDVMDAVGGADTIVQIHSDSVLSCPPGETCTSAGATKMQAAIFVLYEGSTKSVYVRAVGADNALMLSSTAAVTGGSTAGYDVKDNTLFDPSGTKKFRYAGKLTDTNEGKFDISAFVPNTYLKFWSGLNANQAGTKPSAVAAAGDAGAAILYTLPSCQVADVTLGSTPGNEQPFANPDIENIECSGRGECDRESGTCQCYEGYFGPHCGQQTVLV